MAGSSDHARSFAKCVSVFKISPEMIIMRQSIFHRVSFIYLLQNPWQELNNKLHMTGIKRPKVKSLDVPMTCVELRPCHTTQLVS